MKHIDTKSFIIGILATALFLACSDTIKKAAIPEAQAATGVADKWDMNQQWSVKITTAAMRKTGAPGWEPYAAWKGEHYWRQRVK